MLHAAEREQLTTTPVANHRLRTPSSPNIRAIQVPAGLDVADTVIVRQLRPGDLRQRDPTRQLHGEFSRRVHCAVPRPALPALPE